MSNQIPDEQRGLYGKYIIRKADSGAMLDGAAFVLRPDRDPAARSALYDYAMACFDRPLLAADLFHWLVDVVPANDRLCKCGEHQSAHGNDPLSRGCPEFEPAELRALAEACRYAAGQDPLTPVEVERLLASIEAITR